MLSTFFLQLHLAGGFHRHCKGLLLAYALRHLNDSPTAHILLAAPSRMERTIRHAIEVAWDRGNLDALQLKSAETVNFVTSNPGLSSCLINGS